MAAYLATYLELVPVACIAGILLYIASAMIKVNDIKLVWREMGQLAGFIMIFTAIMVVVTDFLVGVLSGLALYFIIIKLKPDQKEQLMMNPE